MEAVPAANAVAGYSGGGRQVRGLAVPVEGTRVAAGAGMTRAIAILLVVVAAACHPTSILKGRVNALGARLGGVAKVVAVVKPVNVDLKAIAVNTARARVGVVADVIADQQPIAYNQTVDVGSSTAAPAPTTQAPAPIPVTVHRTVAPPAVFVMHGTSRSGRNSCKTYTSMQQCTSECTSSLRASSMSRDPEAPQSCNCLEAAGC